MPTARITPSTYYLSNSNYLTVANEDNMYANTDSTSVGTVTETRSSTSSYYIYLRGFDFTSIPAGAIVSSIEVKLKAYHSGGNTGTIYLYDGTTQFSKGGSTTALGTSAAVKTFTNTTATLDELKACGSDLGIRINCRRANSSTQAVIYIYGAEIAVTYTVPVYYNVTASGDGTLIPSGTTSVLEGNTYTLKITGVSSPTVTDNGVDVTSQLVESTTDTLTQIPTGNTNSGFTLTNIERAYADAESGDYAQLELGGRTSGTLYLNLPVTLPSGATVQSVTCQATFQYNRNGSSSGYTASCQLYSNTTAKGSATSLVTAGGTDVAKTKFTLTPGSWTVSDLANARLQITATNNASSTHRYLYVYGVSFSVTYTADGKIYTYTLTNVRAAHTIVVSAGAATDAIYFKSNGAWVEASAVYKKINGSWVLQSDLTNVFQSGANYVKGN